MNTCDYVHNDNYYMGLNQINQIVRIFENLFTSNKQTDIFKSN